MARLGEIISPARLGTPFRWLMASTWTSNLGDGIALAAGPLLVASLTTDPLLVAFAALAGWLPPMLFSLPAGVVSDRFERRTVVITGNLLRVIVLLGLIAVLATGQATIALVLAAVFILSAAQVFVDNALSTTVPFLVDRDDLAPANQRLMGGFLTMNQLAGPPIGGFLFAAGLTLPFVSQVILVAAAIVLMTRLRGPPRERDPAAPRRHVLSDVREGLAWSVRHPAVRTLLLTIFIFNLTFGAAWSVLVLYASQRLGLGEIGFGLITTVGAVGGLVGTLGYGWLARRLRLATLMRIGLIIETVTHLALALTTVWWIAMPIFFVFGAHAFIWGTTSGTVRQRITPGSLQGRVSSVNALASFAGLVVGSGVGGVLAQQWGVTAPFWYAFIGSALFVVIIWRQLRHIDIADDAPAPSSN